MKNLMLGVAFGYSKQQLLPFVKTLRNTGFKGGVVLFVDSLSDSDKNQLKNKYSVTLHEKNEYPKNTALRKTFSEANISPNVSRYLIYYDYVLAQKNLGNVFIADTRDMIFQDNLDNYPVENALHVFLETKGTTINKASLNKQWIASAYGEEAANSIGEKTVSCSGFTFGNHQNMNQYLSQMVEEINSRLELGIGVTGGMDQGIHNYLLHNDKLQHAKMHENCEFGVCTMGFETATKYKNGLLLDKHDKPFTVVHQYDRHGKLLRKYQFSEYLKSIDLNVVKRKLFG